MLVEEEICVRTDAGEMTTFVARPADAGPLPVAVVYMDGHGYREQIKQNARRFAAAGYYCVVPDLFYRQGERLSFDSSRMEEEGYRDRFMSVVSSVKSDAAVSDTEAIFDRISHDPAASAGAKVCIGYCMGSRLALHAVAAMPHTIVAAAGIHPGILVTEEPQSPHHDLASVRGELYFAFAENDQWATPEVVARFCAEIDRQGVRATVERWPGTSHGFALSDLPTYNHDAAERHVERTLELWHRSLTSASPPS